MTITARGVEALERTAEEIRRETGVRVTAVAGDITPEEGRAAALVALALTSGEPTAVKTTSGSCSRIRGQTLPTNHWTASMLGGC